MTSKQEDSASSACCPSSAWGKLSNDDDSSTSYDGIDAKIGTIQLPIYYAKSPTVSKKAIVIWPDVYGMSNRLRLIADSFAFKGYHAMVMDSFHGDSMANKPDDMTKIEWLSQYSYESSVSNDINAGFDFLHDKGVEKGEISVIGFCWGGWAIAKSASEGIKWKCAVSPHPSVKIENVIFGRDEKVMMDKVSIPYLLLPAGDDPENVKAGSEIVGKLEERGGGSVLFESMSHGWVSRGDLSILDVKENAEKALTLAVEFIDKHY